MTVSTRRPGARTTRRRLVAAAFAGLAVLALAACSGGDGGTSQTSPATTAAADTTTAAEATTTPEAEDTITGDLVVYAAASLNEVFTELGDQLMAQHPGLTVTFNFAASSTLAEQVNSGAPVDVLATASAATMGQVGELAIDPTTFASNTLVIVTPAGNPGGVTGIADFANADLRLAVCAEEAPCGAASVKVFAAIGLTPAIDTYAENVTAARNLAIEGEVDASLVYATDALSAGDQVETITFPEASEAVNDNLVAALTDAPNPEAAAAFVALVLSPQGQAVFTDAGFAPAQ